MAPIREGAWYLVSHCIFCRSAIPYIEVDKDVTIGGDGSGVAEMPCPMCHATATYRLEDMVVVQCAAAVPPDVTRH